MVGLKVGLDRRPEERSASSAGEADGVDRWRRRRRQNSVAFRTGCSQSV